MLVLIKWNQLENDEVEANDYEEVDENELKFEINEDLYQREKRRSNEVMPTLSISWLYCIQMV